jgi:hypothetical protein
LENGWLASRRRGRPDHEKRAISLGTAVPPLPLDIHTDRSGTAGRLYDLVHIPPLGYFRIAGNGCIEEVIMTAAPGIRGDLMSGMNDKELGELRKTFDEFDLNGDGFINPEEFHALLIKLDGDVSREECLLDFDVADSEGDGYIGFKEFVVWWTN